MLNGLMGRVLSMLAVAVALAGCSSFVRRPNSFRDDRWEIPVLKSAPAPEGKELTAVTYAIVGSDDRISVRRRTERPCGFLGATLLQVDDDPLPGGEPFFGVLIGQVVDKSPAFVAGLEDNDLVITADGEAMSNAQRLKYLIESHDLTKPLKLEIERHRQRRELSIPLTTRKAQEVESEQYNLSTHEDHEFSGGDLGQLDHEVARYFFENGETGVMLMAIQPGSPLFYSELRRGDVLLAVDNARIASVEQLLGIFEQQAKSGASVRITARRGFKTLNAEFKPRADYESSFSMKIPIVVDYKLRTESTELDIGWGWIFNYDFDAFYDQEEPRHSRSWGMILDLIEYHNNGERRRVRLLWFIPIRW